MSDDNVLLPIFATILISLLASLLLCVLAETMIYMLLFVGTTIAMPVFYVEMGRGADTEDKPFASFIPPEIKPKVDSIESNTQLEEWRREEIPLVPLKKSNNGELR